jgi:hypothetical protein
MAIPFKEAPSPSDQPFVHLPTMKVRCPHCRNDHSYAGNSFHAVGGLIQLDECRSGSDLFVDAGRLRIKRRRLPESAAFYFDRFNLYRALDRVRRAYSAACHLQVKASVRF